MHHSDEIIIESQDTQWVGIRSVRDGHSDEGRVKLFADFTVDDVVEALLATGWVERHDVDERLIASQSCTVLSETVRVMFAYFTGRGQPTAALLDVVAAVSEFYVVQELPAPISLWAHAWLDLVIRDDLAREVQGVPDIWSQRPLTLDAERHCARRVKELVLRLAKSSATPSHRMAPSASSRSPAAAESLRVG